MDDHRSVSTDHRIRLIGWLVPKPVAAQRVWRVRDPVGQQMTTAVPATLSDPREDSRARPAVGGDICQHPALSQPSRSTLGVSGTGGAGVAWLRSKDRVSGCRCVLVSSRSVGVESVGRGRVRFGSVGWWVHRGQSRQTTRERPDPSTGGDGGPASRCRWVCGRSRIHLLDSRGKQRRTPAPTAERSAATGQR